MSGEAEVPRERRTREGEERGPGEARTHDCSTSRARPRGSNRGEGASRSRRGDANGAGQAEPCERGGEPVDREGHTQTRCYPHRGPNLEETPEEEGGVEAP